MAVCQEVRSVTSLWNKVIQCGNMCACLWDILSQVSLTSVYGCHKLEHKYLYNGKRYSKKENANYFILHRHLNIQCCHFSHPGEFFLSEFWYSWCFNNKRQGRKLFGNESNLHTKTAFTYNISHWTHKLWPAVPLSAIQCSTHSVFSVLARQKVEIWLPK